MRLTILTISALLAALVSAQTAPQLPTCANSCVVGGVPQSCNLDPKCICSSESFITSISCCVSKACDTADQNATLAYANFICNPVGVTNLPKVATCAATAGGSSTATGSSSHSSSMSMSMSMSSSSSEAAATQSTSATVAASNTIGAGTSTASSPVSTASGSSGDRLVAQGMGAFGAALLGFAAIL